VKSDLQSAAIDNEIVVVVVGAGSFLNAMNINAETTKTHSIESK